MTRLWPVLLHDKKLISALCPLLSCSGGFVFKWDFLPEKDHVVFPLKSHSVSTKHTSTVTFWDEQQQKCSDLPEEKKKIIYSIWSQCSHDETVSYAVSMIWASHARKWGGCAFSAISFFQFTALCFLKNADDVSRLTAIIYIGERKNTHFIFHLMEKLFGPFLHLCQNLHFASPSECFSINSLCLI